MSFIENLNNLSTIYSGGLICLSVVGIDSIIRKHTHRMDASTEYKIKQTQLKELYEPAMEIFLPKQKELVMISERHFFHTYKASNCVRIDPLSPEENDRISELVRKYHALAPPSMIDTWYQYLRSGEKTDLLHFFNQLNANYNWTRQCIGLPCDDLAINNDYLPKRRSLYISELIYSLFLTLMALLGLILYFCIPEGLGIFSKVTCAIAIALGVLAAFQWVDYVDRLRIGKL